MILGVGAGHVEAEFDVLGIPFAERGRLTDEAIDGIRAAWADEFGWGDGGFGQRPRPRQRRRPADLGRRLVAGRPPPGRRAGRRLAAAGHARRHDMPAAIARIQRAARRGRPRPAPFTIGAIVRPLYVGDPADWDVGKATLAGDARAPPPGARRLRGDGRRPGAGPLPLAARCDELVDQIAALRRGGACDR